jgi:hypothetical protein
VTNTTSTTLELTGATVMVSRPRTFASLSLTAAVSGPSETALAPPAAKTTFTFVSPVSIPPAETATLSLKGTAVVSVASAATAGSFRGRPDNSHGATPLSLALMAFAGIGAALIWEPRRRGLRIAGGLILACSIAAVSASCGGGSNGASPVSSLTSVQSVARGGVTLTEGQGDIIVVSGLPVTLSTVTVEF